MLRVNSWRCAAGAAGANSHADAPCRCRRGSGPGFASLACATLPRLILCSSHASPLCSALLQKYRLYLKRAQGLQNGKGSKGHKAAAEAAMLDPQAAAAAAAVAAGAGPSSVFAQVAAAQQAGTSAAAALQTGAMGMQPGLSPTMQPGMPVMGMPNAAQMAAAWQQQTMAMQAAAAAAAASGALPGAVPAALPFPMPAGAMMPPHMAGEAGRGRRRAGGRAVHSAARLC